jgi:hypothetical protein
MLDHASLVRFALVAAVTASWNLYATPILAPGPFTGPYDVVAQARNGRTGWEAALFAPDNLPAYMNPSGAPVWVAAGCSPTWPLSAS